MYRFGHDRRQMRDIVTCPYPLPAGGRSMGSRGRSIRLRIYFLVAIPLITMLGLFGYVAYTSTTTYLNLDREPTLINATAEPLTNFVNKVQAERRAAVVYLSHPSAASLAAYRGAIATTQAGQRQVTAG